MASGQVMFGGRSVPGGRGGRPPGTVGWYPVIDGFGGGCCALYPDGAPSSFPPTCEKSTRSSRPIIS